MKNKDPVRKNLYDMVKNECVRICVRVERRMFSANTFLSTHSWNIVYPFIRNKERGSPLATELMGSTLLFWRFGYLWYFLNQSTKQQRGCRSVTSLKQYSSLHVYQDCLQHEHMHTVHLYLNPYFQFRLNSAHSASSGSHWALGKPLCSGWGCSEIISSTRSPIAPWGMNEEQAPTSSHSHCQRLKIFLWSRWKTDEREMCAPAPWTHPEPQSTWSCISELNAKLPPMNKLIQVLYLLLIKQNLSTAAAAAATYLYKRSVTSYSQTWRVSQVLHFVMLRYLNSSGFCCSSALQYRGENCTFHSTSNWQL